MSMMDIANALADRIETLETALSQLKRILAHDYRNLPISEIDRDNCLAIIKSTLGGDQNQTKT